MRAAVFKEYGPPDVVRVEDVARPVPKSDEVLIRVHAATVATADCEVRSFTFVGWSWLPIRLMFGVFRPRKLVQVLGQELAGVVEAVGANVTAFKAGDAVMAAIEGFGAHADYKCMRADSAIALKPAHASFAEAATFTVFALNALHFIRKAALRPGQKILINGAGSSIGTPAVQLAKHAGAHVTAVDSAGKLEMLRTLGADETLDYAGEDFTKRGQSYDVILDVIGKSPYGRSLRALKPGGRYILANPKTAPMLRSLWTNRVSSKRVMFALAGASADNLNHVRGLVEAGRLKAVIDRTYPLEQITDAHRYVASGAKKGNVVVLLRPDGEL